METLTLPPFVRGPESEDHSQFGGKARALAALVDSGLPIPSWFVILPSAFDATLSAEQRVALSLAEDDSRIQQVLATLSPSGPWVADVQHALADLCADGVRVAVRSSALDEDGVAHSFAGQLESYLFVEPAQVLARVLDVWRSGFSERVFTYRRERGIAGLPQAPAVLVQRMVVAHAAGVAFGADPVSGRRSRSVVSAVYGLGTALVSGDADADTYHVDKNGEIVVREIAHKEFAHRYAANVSEGVSNVAVSEALANSPALSDSQVRDVAALVQSTSRLFGCPQDIEWALENGKLFLLQSRPITSITSLADLDGALNLWDNSNIAESYGGITTPLTFSFARRAYEEVYRQFCYLMRVPTADVAAQAVTFRRMLGLVRGRVYYNLLSWYRVLATLPGFAMNRRFMEQMMGVKEGLPAEMLAEFGTASFSARLRDSVRFARTLVGLVANHWSLSRRIKEFYLRLNHALAPRAVETLRADELATYYLDLERQLLTRWDAPLVNDFFAMIFYGVLRALAAKWCADTAGNLQNDLLCAEGGMVSTEPARRVREMAEIAAHIPALRQALCDAPLPMLRRAIVKAPNFNVAYESYLAKFGDRCLDELKLESATLLDDPLPLLRSVGQFAMRMSEGPVPAGIEMELRLSAEKRVSEALASRPIRRVVFGWVLKHTRARVRDRENLRFERTRLFGLVRRIFVQIGRRFHADGLLDTARDIFYLEIYEVIGFIDGTATTTDLKGLVALRRREFDSYRTMAVPDDRFDTRGVVHQGNRFQAATAAAPVTGDMLTGIGCCPGLVRGRVRVITDPRGASLQRGDILVAERTDPGWIMLFPAAAGILVERGSLLSHSAIVARELGIPAIVSIAGITRWLRDGDWVEFDGSTGKVWRVAPEEKNV